MSKEVVDEELRELEEMKEKLVQRALNLQDRLHNQKVKTYQSDLTSIIFPLETEDDFDPAERKSNEKTERWCCEASCHVLGVTFEEVDKKWLRDEVYLYTADVKTKVLQFFLELTIDLKDKTNYEIIDITCHFTELSKSGLLEITEWVQEFTRMKNFSYLMSAVAEYSECSIARAKILQKHSTKSYLTIKMHNENEGGVLVYIHSADVAKEEYLTVKWTLQFRHKTWRIEHCFTIKALEAGYDFAECNGDLLKEFCEQGLTKKNLEDLWKKLCDAIHAHGQRKSPDDKRGG